MKIEDVVEACRDPNTRLAMARELKECVVCLDVDECSIVGGDTCDLLRCLQNFSRAIIDRQIKGEMLSADEPYMRELRSNPDFIKLLRLLVNPKMVEAVQGVAARLKYMPAIVIYTAKSDLVVKSGNHLHEEFFAAFKRFPEGSGTTATEILIPGDNILAGPDYLRKQLVAETEYVCHDIHGESAGEVFTTTTQLPVENYTDFQRAGFCFWAIADALGLAYVPHAVVTAAGDKDLRTMSEIIGVPFEKLVLFDDKSARHASRLQPEPQPLAAARMVQIPPYTFQTMCQTRRAELEALVKQIMPEAYLREAAQANPKLFREASCPFQAGWPRANLVLRRDFTWKLGQEDAAVEPAAEEAEWERPEPHYLDADRQQHAKRVCTEGARSFSEPQPAARAESRRCV